MRTVITKKVETRVEQLQFGYWNEANNEFIPIEKLSSEEMIELLDCSPTLANAIIMLTDDIKEMIGSDLADIWARLDELEG